MRKDLQKISTKGMSHDEWLQIRKERIGGSEAGAIIGLSEYATAVSVWADKKGITPAKADNEAMRQGRDLEQYVADRFTEATGKKVRRENNILVNPDYPFAHANVDRVIIGEDALLECKTTSVLNTKLFRGTEFPDKYYAQCVHYLAVTGCRKIYLAVLILGNDFKVYELERDEAEIASLMAAEKEFYGYLQSDEIPPVDGLKPTTDALGAIFGDGDPDAPDADLTGFEGDIRRYVDLKAEIKAKENDLDLLANNIKVAMGDSFCGGTERYRVFFKPQTRRSFNSKAFAKDHPELDMDKYYTETVTRPFSVKERKE